MENKTEMYNQNKKMISSIAKKRSFDAESYEEKVAQGNLVFAECLSRYDGRCKFSTYLYESLDKKLIDPEGPEFVELSENSLVMNDPEPLFLSDLNLSPEAWEIVTEILQAPLGAIESKKNKVTKQSLKQHLHASKGWPLRYIERLFHEIEIKLERAIA